MTPLIDATEMYLRTVWELEEEGITPIRARLVERLGVSAPAVSETVAKLVDEGLMRIGADRTLSLTGEGNRIALSVMRKHRLAERLLTDVIGVPWEAAHNEACRWEHVISDSVEGYIESMLGHPATCPHGNPIPSEGDVAERERLHSAAEAAKEELRVEVTRLSELIQADTELMGILREGGIVPGAVVSLRTEAGAVLAETAGGVVELPAKAADLVYVVPHEG
ncbi:MAG: iron dependent repressor, metal binding and dimerization domain protein [Egibacteraceae bacterium]